VPAALSRWDGDHSFNILPILYGITFGELEQHCAAHNLRSLKEFNGVSLPVKDTGAADAEFNRKLREVAKRILEATLTLRLRRAGADRNYEPCLFFIPTGMNHQLIAWTSMLTGQGSFPVKMPCQWRKCGMKYSFRH